LASFDDYVEAFREQLDQSVRCRLRGTEKSIAAHLSGGWDSSAVTATAARLVKQDGRKIIAFTSIPRAGVEAPAPNHRFADEGPIAAATAAIYPNIKHILMPGCSASPIAKLDFYVEHFDRPLHNLCNHVWLSEIRDAARANGARIMLTGEIGNFTISSAPANLLADFLRERRFLAWSREAVAAALSRRARIRGIIASSFGPWIPNLIWNRVRHLSAAPELGLATALHPEIRERVAKEQEAQRMGLAWRPKDNFRSTLEGIFAMDWGEYRKGILGGWHLDKRDATADTRLIEFCLSLPLNMLLRDGMRRPLAQAALADRLPAAVLEERRKGYQAADWSVGLSQDLQSVNVLLDKIAQHPLAGRMIDVDLLRTLVRDWPQRGWEEPKTMVRYRTALLHALSAGHFIASMPD
jgi:asparagine synthase (glutamine-hydrolysing)